MAKRDTKKQPPEFQHVTVAVYRPGLEMVSCDLNDPRATTFGLNKAGERCSAQRPIANVFAVEIRSATRKTGACYQKLHDEVWSQPLGEAPVVPANALFIAKAFELAETANA